MFRTRYLIRLDDACPTMNCEKWGKMEALLDKYGAKPMVGVIPHNEDPKQRIDPEDPHFWEKVKSWERKGWAIAMHGYNHVYSSKEGGINPLWNKSEFAGHPYELQRKKIKDGIAVMRRNGFDPHYFFAPSHTFDENTLRALQEETKIRIISDTIARKPYRKSIFVFIPQQSGHPRRLPFGGYMTICYHPNTMSDSSFARLECFLKRSKDSIISFDQIDINEVGRKGLLDSLLSWAYFTKRKLK